MPQSIINNGQQKMEKTLESLKKELQTIYPEATIIDIHNMIQDLTDFCLACANATIQEKQKQVANDNEKIPEKSSQIA